MSGSGSTPGTQLQRLLLRETAFLPLEALLCLGGQVEGRVRRVLLVHEELGEPADRRAGHRVDGDDAHRLRHHLPAVIELQDGEHFDGRRDRGDLVRDGAGCDHRLDFVGRERNLLPRGRIDERIAFLVRPHEAVHAGGVDHHVGHHAVHAVLQLRGEPAHHGVDDDERGDPEHHGDDADEREVARLEIAEAEQQLVHEWESFPARSGNPPRRL
jgi:hypothetical protein